MRAVETHPPIPISRLTIEMNQQTAPFEGLISAMFDIADSRELLNKAGVFFHNATSKADDHEYTKIFQTLNMNDVWGWACADGEYVPDEELPQVAELFWRYGNCGILYWVSERNGRCRSEFRDINRFVDFVREEEAIRVAVPDSSERAYAKYQYTVGGET